MEELEDFIEVHKTNKIDTEMIDSTKFTMGAIDMFQNTEPYKRSLATMNSALEGVPFGYMGKLEPLPPDFDDNDGFPPYCGEALKYEYNDQSSNDNDDENTETPFWDNEDL